jgi:hypothetical protein
MFDAAAYRRDYYQRNKARQDRLSAEYRIEHPLFGTWNGMVTRCTNPKHVAYKRYGGRGITVYPDWLGRGGFLRYEDWVLANLGPRPEGMTLDRIDNDRGYAPGNLRWATAEQQAGNRRHR